MHNYQRKISMVAAVLAACALSACDKTPDMQNKSAVVEAPPSSPRSADATVGTKVADATITAKVKSKFIADDELKALQIDVDTNSGAVTLRGTVASAAAKDRATVVAREVEGVKTVDNQLMVASG